MGLNKYLFIAFFPVGFISNIFSFLVMRMKHNRHLSTCVYMSVTAINDNIFLVLALHLWFAKHVESTHYTDWVCKFKVYTVFASGTFGAYEILLMTLDKFIAIKMPHKAASICTAKRAKILSTINLVVTLVFYLPNWYFSSTLGNTIQCSRYVKKGWYVNLFMYVAFVINPLVPVLAISLMNFVIIRAVWKSRNIRGNQGEKSTERQVTVMLILVSVMFIILLLPFEIRDLYHYYSSQPSTPKEFANFVFSFRLTKEIFNLNYGINFFLYLISGSKFRGDLKSIFVTSKSGNKGKSESSISHSFPESGQTDTDKI